ncbi:hypothetical protein V6N11_050944 [Hibiscus sabdariffa]|uniref:DUF4283 domain-containing protein n=1 Tax=Hibiscus sabdariffa TaxID=183260 RepID=A0ABR2R2E8_9ROSI
MASTSFLNQFQDLDFTNEEQGAVFTPTIQWDSMNDDSNLLIIGKLISSNSIDDNAVVRAFQGIWKHNKIVSITTVKSNYYRIKFPTEDIRNDILSRGPWIFKGDWLALAALNPTYSIDEYTFFPMNVWIRIYGIPSILMDDDDIANHTGNSLGTMIGKVVKVDTRRNDLNMVDYLRIGIVLDVTKPVRRCVAIEGSGPSPKLYPLQYGRLPTLCHGCGIIGHALDACSTFKPTPNSKLQYGNWLRYIPPKKQEQNTRSKGSIQYLDGARSSKPKTTANGKLSSNPFSFDGVQLSKTVADAESTNAPINPVATTVPMVVVIGTPFLAATDPLGTIIAMEPKLAAATAPIALTMAVANTPQVSIEPFGSTMVPTTNSFGGPEGFIDFLANPTETHTEVPYLLDNMGLDAVTTTILSIPREGGLENEMGAKRRSSMQNDNKLKKPRPPNCFKD